MSTANPVTVCTSGTAPYDVTGIQTDPARSTTERQCAGFGQTAGLNGSLSTTWTRNRCEGIYQGILFTTNTPTNQQFAYNPDNLNRISEDMFSTLTTVFGTDGSGFDLTGSNPFQNVLLNVCRSNTSIPGACDHYLCNVLCPQYTYDEISNTPSIANWCGAYIPPPPDQTDIYYQQLSPGAVVPYNSPDNPGDPDVGLIPCFPLYKATTVQLFQPSSGIPYYCNNNVCVIDDVLIQSDQAGGTNVQYTQVCPGCSNDPDTVCTCIISSSDLTGTIDDMGISTTFNQYCGTNSTCYEADATGNLTLVQCGDFTSGTNVPAFSSAIPWIVTAIVIFIVIIAILVLIATRSQKRAKIVPTKYDPSKPIDEGPPPKGASSDAKGTKDAKIFPTKTPNASRIQFD